MATPTPLGGGTGTITGSTTGTAAFSPSVTAGSALIGGVVTTHGVAVTLVTDTLGNLWTIGTSQDNASGARVTPIYSNNSLGGANTVSVTIGSSGNAAIAVEEYSNVGSVAGNVGILDNSNGNSGNNTVPTTTSTQNVGSSLVIAIAGDISGSSLTYTAGSSLTNRQSVAGTVDIVLADKIGPAGSLTSTTTSFTVTSTQWTIVSLAFRPAGVQPGRRRAQSSAAAAASLGIAITPNLGEFLIYEVETGATGVTTNTMTDNSANNVWTLIGRSNNASGGELSAWWCFSTTGSAITVTANLTGGTANVCGAIYSLYGVIPSANPIDVVATNQGNGTAVSVGPSAVPVLNNELAVLCVGSLANLATTTPGGSATAMLSNPTANGSVWMETLLTSSAAAQTMTATVTTGQWSGLLFTVKTGPSFVQSVSATSASAALNPTMPFNCAAGNTLVAAAMVNNHTGLSGITGPTFTQALTTNNASGGSSDIWYAANIAGGKISPTAAATTVAKAVIFYEISGLTSSPFDVTGTHTANDQAVTATSAQPNFLFELAVLASGDVGTGKSYTATSPATIVQADVTTNVDLMGALVCQFTTGTTAPPAITMAGSIPTAAVQHSDSLATFKITGSPTSYVRSVTDTLTTLTDTIARQYTAQRSVTDTLTTLTDSLTTRAYTATRSLTDTLTTVTDSIARRLILTRGLTDTLTPITDSLQRSYIAIRGLTDTLPSLSDMLSYFLPPKAGTAVTTMVDEWTALTSMTDD